MRGLSELRPDESFALHLDETDPLRGYRDEFRLPAGADGKPRRYFLGNSLGLQPKWAEALVREELDRWARLAVDAHFDGDRPWYSYHELFREPVARLVGARPVEVVLMNSLTVNLHLLLVSFFRPTASRWKILIEDPVFPSDLYAVQTQLRHNGLDPATALVRVRPRSGEATLRTEDVEWLLREEGSAIALVLLGGVNFLTGQRLDLARIARVAKAAGCNVGFDLAHAAGNVPLRLHDWDVDFAAWCSYKYLNGGPGAPAGCFIHERHVSETGLTRFGGWWGNDPATRFDSFLAPEFVPAASADGWQISNPPILAMAPLLASLDLFDRAGMDGLREKSERLTGYLLYLLGRNPPRGMRILTPADPEARGCQVSLAFDEGAREAHARLNDAGVVCDFRPPDVIRLAPVPLYNTFHEVWAAAQAIANLGSGSP